jgi:hypothetical protein
MTEKKEKPNWFTQFMSILFVVILVVGIGSMIGVTMLKAATGYDTTPQDVEIAEVNFCALQGMKVQTKMVESCSLFGCQSLERTFCTDGHNEKKIDYGHKFFCELSVYDDMIGC